MEVSFDLTFPEHHSFGGQCDSSSGQVQRGKKTKMSKDWKSWADGVKEK